LDFRQDLKTMLREVEALWHREQAHLEGSRDDLNALEHFGTSGLKRLSVEPVHRAVGLWLWDHMQENGKGHGAFARAYRELEANEHFKSLELGKPDYTDIRRWFNWTDNCISQGEVLPFTKLGLK